MSNTLSTIAPPTATSAAQPSAKTVGTVKQMEGVLWYEMLSELNKNGLDTSSLGAGSDAFQDSFLWNLAQNDFSKYDTALTAATITQIGPQWGRSPCRSGADHAVGSGLSSASCGSGAHSGADDGRRARCCNTDPAIDHSGHGICSQDLAGYRLRGKCPGHSAGGRARANRFGDRMGRCGAGQ